MMNATAGCMPISIPLRSITMGMHGIDRIVKQYADLSRKSISLLTSGHFSLTPPYSKRPSRGITTGSEN